MSSDDKKIDDLLKEIRLIKSLLVASLIASGVEATVIAKKILHYTDVSALSHELPVTQLKKAIATVKVTDGSPNKVSGAKRKRRNPKVKH
jgi:hypothetical protein